MGTRLALLVATLVAAYAVRAVTHSHTAFIAVIAAGFVVRVVLRFAGSSR